MKSRVARVGKEPCCAPRPSWVHRPLQPSALPSADTRTWVVTVLFAVLAHHHAMSAPVSRTGDDHPLWVNPCNLPDDASGHADHLSPQDVRNMLDAVANRARVASEEADKAKRRFVSTGLFSILLAWLGNPRRRVAPRTTDAVRHARQRRCHAVRAPRDRNPVSSPGARKGVSAKGWRSASGRRGPEAQMRCRVKIRSGDAISTQLTRTERSPRTLPTRRRCSGKKPPVILVSGGNYSPRARTTPGRQHAGRVKLLSHHHFATSGVPSQWLDKDGLFFSPISNEIQKKWVGHRLSVLSLLAQFWP